MNTSSSAAGSPPARPSADAEDPTVTKITVFPEQRIMTRNNRQQFAVHAHYSDGIDRRRHRSGPSTKATTPRSPSSTAPAWSARSTCRGEAAIMARYPGQVATFRATVPLGVKIPDYKFEAQDRRRSASRKRNGKSSASCPRDLCSDEHFIRRVYLDITGTLPTPKQVKEFLADKDAAKRDKLVDRLLETPEYSYLFANSGPTCSASSAATIRTRTGPFGTFAFHNWIRESIAKDKPYDQFAREILAAIGDESKSPADGLV